MTSKKEKKRTRMSNRQYERTIILLSLTRWLANQLDDVGAGKKIVTTAHLLIDQIALAVGEEDDAA
jgi:hypothetical protein